MRRQPSLGVLALAVCSVALGASAAAEQPEGLTRIAAEFASEDLRQWDLRIDLMLRDGSLELTQVTEDTLLPDRKHERFHQLHQGVPIYGATLTRQVADGRPVSIFGSVYNDVNVDVTPRLRPDEAKRIIEKLAGAELGPGRQPSLLIYPTGERGYVLAYSEQVMVSDDLRAYFVNANTGVVVGEFSNLQRQSAVGSGHGVLGDRKKVSAVRIAGHFYAEDQLRPPAALLTFDMRGDLGRVIRLLNGNYSVTRADVASDEDNAWGDVVAVDAHAYAGWLYDYFYKRFGRRGLNDGDSAIWVIVHPVSREHVALYDNRTVNTFFTNAFFHSRSGVVVLGEGLPFRLPTGQHVNYLAGGLDIVVHELAHGVTAFSSRLVYQGESGALNEAFSDIVGVGAEFHFQPRGNGAGQADYLIGEDVITPGGIRSLEHPAIFGHPDHYARRYLGTDDNGGVHTNSLIAGHAFYLAIEGGTNRTSGLTVQGVGAANREQIERVFYRAFVYSLPSNADFLTARAATIQSARDLYGTGSQAERAITQAWNAVGVVPQGRTSTSFTPDPVPASPTNPCGGGIPAWNHTVTVAEVGGVGIRIDQARITFYGPSGAQLAAQDFDFASVFGVRHITAGGSARASVCVTLSTAGGSVDYRWGGVDDHGSRFLLRTRQLRLLAPGFMTSATRDSAIPGLATLIK